MGAIAGIETITCHHCHATYVATFKHGSAGQQTCDVCGHLLLTWTAERSYTDFVLVRRPTDWKPASA
jgi:hypothetical protein